MNDQERSIVGRLYTQWVVGYLRQGLVDKKLTRFSTETGRQIDEEVRLILLPSTPALPLTQEACDTLSLNPHTQRLYDLVRYARGYLSREELITLEEYAYLVSTGSSSARRLETYDQIKGTRRP